MMTPDSHEAVDSERPPWGFWATMGLGLSVFVVTQLVVAVVFGLALVLVVGDVRVDSEALEGLTTNGLFVAVTTCTVAPLSIGLVILFVVVRRGWRIDRYLGLQKVGAGQVIGWVGIAFFLALLYNGLALLLGRPIVSEFMIEAYETAFFTPLLWLALVVAAPLYEEILFRGFLFRGIQHSRLGPAGAIVITSLLWAPLHLQYDLFGVVSIFVGGFVLGLARLRTGSIYTPILMHAFNNLLATIETAVKLALD